MLPPQTAYVYSCVCTVRITINIYTGGLLYVHGGLLCNNNLLWCYHYIHMVDDKIHKEFKTDTILIKSVFPTSLAWFHSIFCSTPSSLQGTWPPHASPHPEQPGQRHSQSSGALCSRWHRQWRRDAERQPPVPLLWSNLHKQRSKCERSYHLSQSDVQKWNTLLKYVPLPAQVWLFEHCILMTLRALYIYT